jgi:hypothetical protein
MAVLYGLDTVIIRFLQTVEEEEQIGAPDEWDDSLDFDLETNEPVREALFADWNAHTLSGGVLRRDGQPVTINAPGESYLARKQGEKVKEALRDLLSGLGQIENVVDFGYAYKARLLAKANGENLATIQAIVDRQTASQYVADMSQWQALTAAQRAWLAVELESQAYDAMVIRLLLT